MDPALLEPVTEFSRRVDEENLDVDAALDDRALVIFARNFFAAFFAQLDAPISGVHQSARREAVRLRLLLTRREGTSQTIRLIRWFENFTRVYFDVSASGYGSSGGASREFYEKEIPRLLERILEWAEAEHDAELAGEADVVLSDYWDALRALGLSTGEHDDA